MLNRIIEFSIKNKLIIGLFVIALIIYGAYQATRLPIDAVPDITNNQVQIITVAPSFGATDIERLVTFPIEQANSNISGLIEMRSFSRFGLSLVTLVFNDETDVYWARQQVAERLQIVQSEIPAGIGVPELGPVSTGLGEIYQYVIRPEKGYESKYDATELRTIQDWIVRRQLLGVKGVAEVSSFGGKLKQFEVAVDPAKLTSYNISINDVFNALEKNNENTGGAYIEKGPTVLFIRSEGLIGTKEDIENISIKNTSTGTPLFIRDVAEVNIGHATRYGAMLYNNNPGEVAGAVVMMLKGANSSEVIKNVKERIELIRKNLPEGVVIESFLDRTKMVNNAIHTVEQNLIEGALIVIFILVLFLGNVRAGFLVASVIPLAMLFAIIMMNTFGVSGNLMSLGALDFGLIVDGAVIIVEAVMHHLSQTMKYRKTDSITSEEMDHIVHKSAGKMMNSAVFGQIIILIVYLPILTLQGIEGKMFKPMAETVAFALIGAFLLSVTYIPMMSSLVLSKRKSGKNFSDNIMEKVAMRYQSFLLRALRVPKTIIASAITLFVIALLVLSSLGGEFIPALEEGDFAVDTRVLTGSNIQTTIENAQKAAGILMKFPEVEKVVTKIGSGEVPTDPMPMEAMDMMVILKPKKQWTSAKTFNELSDKMSDSLKQITGITTGFQYPVQMRFNELMTGARQDVVCKIFGENLDTLSKYAEELGKIINETDGTQDLYVEPVTGMPQIVINYNRYAIAQYNLNIADINRVVNSAFAGQITGMLYEDEKRFSVVVKLENEKRKDLEDVRNLLIPGSAGRQIPLYQLADVDLKVGPNQIQREDAKRRIVAGFNIRKKDVQTVIEDLQKKVDSRLKLPAGYYITYGGAFENLNAAKQRLLIAVPVSLLLIFILLFFAFNSLRQGLLIYTAIPLSAIGGILFLALRGLPFSISAGVGFIALFGVAVLNGIVLIAEFNRIKSSGVSNLARVVVKGTHMRLRPVLMTALVASLGFLPMALSNGAGAEVQRPLATVVIGGLILATFLTLFVLPVMYMLFEKRAIKNSLKIATAILILVLTGKPTSAQQPITLQAAIDSALTKNLGIKNEKLQAEYKKQLSKTGYNIQPATVMAEFGNYNSAFDDNRISVNQSFSFPTIYSRQKKLYSEEYRSALLNEMVKEKEIIRNVSSLYFSILLIKEKLQLLKEADSIYAVFLRNSELRFEKGETNTLEKITAENQRANITIQMQEVERDLAILRLQFNLFLNTSNIVEPVTINYRIERKLAADTLSLNAHPLLQYAEQQIKIAKAIVKLERSGYLPDIHAGFSSTTIRGIGADNIFYDKDSRFNSAQIGLGIPLFFGSKKNKIRSAKTELAIAQNNAEQQRQLLNEQYLIEEEKYKTALAQVNYFESIANKNADTILNAASKQLNGGDINYLEWVMLTNQAFTIKNNYIESVRNLNETILQLQYLISNR